MRIDIFYCCMRIVAEFKLTKCTDSSITKTQIKYSIVVF